MKKNFKSIITLTLVGVFFLFSSFTKKIVVSNYLINYRSAITIDTLNFDAVLLTTHSDIVGRNGNILPYACSTMAGFHNNYSEFGNAGTVAINDSVIYFKKHGYIDTMFLRYKTPVTWKVSGSELFPAFSFTNTDSMPVYTGYNLLPDTIYNNGQDINITVAGNDIVDVMQVWFLNQDNNKMLKRNINGLGVATFAYSDLTSNFLSQNPSVSIIVHLSRYNIQNILGKRVNFVNGYDLVKKVVFINNQNNNNRLKH